MTPLRAPAPAASRARQRRRWRSSWAVVGALALAAPAAAESWLQFRGSPRCSAAPGALAARISGGVAGARDPALSVAIELDDRPAGTTALVRLARGSRELGAKRIVAASCAEALDAASAVAALALGKPPPPVAPDDDQAPLLDQAPLDVASPLAAPRPGASASSRPPLDEQAAPEPERGMSPPPDRQPAAGPPPVRPAAASPSLHGLWSAGLDRGALTALTPVLGLGVGASIGRDEVRVRLAYGVPLSSEQEESSTGLERRSSDFAALTIDGCRALAGADWLSFCAGLEARATRSSERLAPADQPASARQRLAASAWALAGASFVYRGVAWQPRLDVSAQLPVLGGPGGADFVGGRAEFGARLPF